MIKEVKNLEPVDRKDNFGDVVLFTPRYLDLCAFSLWSITFLWGSWAIKCLGVKYELNRDIYRLIQNVSHTKIHRPHLTASQNHQTLSKRSISCQGAINFKFSLHKKSINSNLDK